MIDIYGCILIWNKGGECNEGYISDEIIGEYFVLLFILEDIFVGLLEKLLVKVIVEGNF